MSRIAATLLPQAPSSEVGRRLPAATDTPSSARGLWLIVAGLWFYDRYARDPSLPRHAVYRVGKQAAVPVDHQRYGWECAFYDAQVRYPERFVLALLEDARRTAAESGVPFQVWTYHEAVSRGRGVEIRPHGGGPAAAAIEPSAIVNATGAWVDDTLQRLDIVAARLMGGTKGSHLITSHIGLRQALDGRGVYAEATDGRPVFLLPWGEQVLIGTTDLPFAGDPADAVASSAEVEYLVAAVNRILPDVRLSLADIDLHYCGVRPLPHVDESTPAAVSRRHWTHEHQGAPWPLYSVIGGKLTTCRSLAEQTADMVLSRLNVPRVTSSRDRPLPGAENFPQSAAALSVLQRGLSESLHLPIEAIQAVWPWWGTRTGTCLMAADASSRDPSMVQGTHLPKAVVRWVIEHEWVTRLDDLVERRLMLLYDPRLSTATLQDLAQLLVEAGKFPEGEIDRNVELTVRRLESHFGKCVSNR